MSITFFLDTFSCFDPFSSHMVELGGVVYPTAEHAYQAGKFLHNQNIHDEILRAISPLQAKNISHQYSSMKDPDWEQKKVEYMQRIFEQKLLQHREILEALQKTGNEDIVEGNVEDEFWGVGSGNGQNYIGKCWMNLRQKYT
jgi:N-glycosidase YbiA